MNVILSNIIQHLPLSENLKLLFVSKKIKEIVRQNLDGFKFKCHPFTTNTKLKLLTKFFKIKNIALIQNSEVDDNGMKYLKNINSIDLRYSNMLEQPRMATKCIRKLKYCKNITIYGAEFLTRKICNVLGNCHTIKLKNVTTIYDIEQILKNCHKISIVESNIADCHTEHFKNCYSINLNRNEISNQSLVNFRYANIVKIAVNEIDEGFQHLRNCIEVDLHMTYITTQQTKYLRNCHYINLYETLVKTECLKNFKQCRILDIGCNNIKINNSSLPYFSDLYYLYHIDMDDIDIDYSTKKILENRGITISY